MLPKSQLNWDDAFANMAYSPGAERLPELWTQEAAAYRASGVRMERDVQYGADPREKYDLIWPDGTPKGLAVFVHGGYWIRLDKSYWTHFAEGARRQGWAVALPQYTLAPQARIAQMTQQIGVAISHVAERVAGPIRLAGHSAGGHLVSRMVCDDSPLPQEVLSRLEHTLSISGLHDLRPLMWTAMNSDLQLDEAEAVSESAALRRPTLSANVTTWVGGGERPEFIRQSQLLAMMWEGLQAQIGCTVEGTHNHFTVIDALKDPDSAITGAFVK